MQFSETPLARNTSLPTIAEDPKGFGKLNDRGLTRAGSCDRRGTRDTPASAPVDLIGLRDMGMPRWSADKRTRVIPTPNLFCPNECERVSRSFVEFAPKNTCPGIPTSGAKSGPRNEESDMKSEEHPYLVSEGL